MYVAVAIDPIVSIHNFWHCTLKLICLHVQSEWRVQAERSIERTCRNWMLAIAAYHPPEINHRIICLFCFHSSSTFAVHLILLHSDVVLRWFLYICHCIRSNDRDRTEILWHYRAPCNCISWLYTYAIVRWSIAHLARKDHPCASDSIVTWDRVSIFCWEIEKEREKSNEWERKRFREQISPIEFSLWIRSGDWLSILAWLRCPIASCYQNKK